MNNNLLLADIDTAEIVSTLSVMESITDAYGKALMILENYEGEDVSSFDIFTESFYMEDGEQQQAAQNNQNNQNTQNGEAPKETFFRRLKTDENGNKTNEMESIAYSIAASLWRILKFIWEKITGSVSKTKANVAQLANTLNKAASDEGTQEEVKESAQHWYQKLWNQIKQNPGKSVAIASGVLTVVLTTTGVLIIKNKRGNVIVEITKDNKLIIHYDMPYYVMTFTNGNTLCKRLGAYIKNQTDEFQKDVIEAANAVMSVFDKKEAEKFAATNNAENLYGKLNKVDKKDIKNYTFDLNNLDSDSIKNLIDHLNATAKAQEEFLKNSKESLGNIETALKPDKETKKANAKAMSELKEEDQAKKKESDKKYVDTLKYAQKALIRLSNCQIEFGSVVTTLNDILSQKHSANTNTETSGDNAEANDNAETNGDATEANDSNQNDNSEYQEESTHILDMDFDSIVND